MINAEAVSASEEAARRVFKTDEEFSKALASFAQMIYRKGYRKHTVHEYLRSAKDYAKTGKPWTEESIRTHYCYDSEGNRIPWKDRRRASTTMSGVMKFYDLCICEGKNTRKKREGMKHPGICDEDCFNCKYPDCVL